MRTKRETRTLINCATCSITFRRTSTAPYCSILCRMTAKLRVDESGCWIYEGSRTEHGYGQFGIKRSIYPAHRVTFELLVEAIPEGLVLDHLCRTPACVNPDHLDVVTQRENVLRGVSPMANQARRTHCIRGHEFDAANTAISKQGKRRCRTCRRDKDRARSSEAFYTAPRDGGEF